MLRGIIGMVFFGRMKYFFLGRIFRVFRGIVEFCVLGLNRKVSMKG